jgi:hypothetical protein
MHPAVPMICVRTFPPRKSRTMHANIYQRASARNPAPPITMGDLMRHKGPEWATCCIQRRYGIRRRHAALVAAMLGCGR